MNELTQEQIDKLLVLSEAIENGVRLDELPRTETFDDKMFTIAVDADGQVGRLNLDDMASDNPIAGRYWDETGSTPTAAGYYGSLQALKELPSRLGLGRYLVTDDRVRRKLAPENSNLFEDGTPAVLDGSMGQCMWCWNAHYYTTWEEGNLTIEAITFAPIRNRDSVYVPAGGKSWFDAGVFDSTTNTLCSLISDDPRYRGGSGAERPAASYRTVPAGSPQQTMLGMPRTSLNSIDCGTAARKRGKGWEANWYIAQAASEYIPRIILGTRNIQAAFNPEKDENGLQQGGMGPGMTTWKDDDTTGNNDDWTTYNGVYPLMPTSFGLEVGDGTTVLSYTVYYADGSEAHTFEVPVFYGYVNPNYGNLFNYVRGILIDHNEVAPSRAYVAPSMFEDFTGNAITDDMLLVGEIPRVSGWIKRLTMRYLSSVPVETAGSSTTYYSDSYFCNVDTALYYGVRVRLSSGRPAIGAGAGAVTFYSHSTPSQTHTTVSSPLCYFEEDPSPLPVTQK